MEFQSITPVLYSSDIRRSIAYYTEILGFDQKWEWDETPTFGGVHNEKNDTRVFFCLGNQGSPGTWICINVDQIDTYYETIKAKGARILSIPDNKDWGLREMLVEDPDGHVIRFGQDTSCD